jgi:putative MATE family efflux protein
MTAPPEAGALDAAPAARTSFWSVVREALRGSRQDYTQGSIPRAILLLAVPMVIEMGLESVFAIVDIFFVGRLGATAVATVGLTESMLSVMYAVAFGLSAGATAMVARRIGEHDGAGASRAAGQSVLLGLVAATAIGGSGIVAGPHLLAALGAGPDVIASGGLFTRVMLGGSGTIMMLFLVNAIFRGAGDAAIAMRVLALANAINIVLDPCLIFGLGPFPRLGVTGAAVATTTGRAIGVAFALSRLLRPGSRVSFGWRDLRLDVSVMTRLVRLSGSAALQTLIGTASWIGLVRIVSTFGSQAIAGYTTGIRIVVFALLPSLGLSNAAATMVGQALGAGRPERGERAVWTTARYDCAVLTAVGVLFLFAARPIVSVFTADPGVVQAGADCLRIVAIGFPFYAFGMVLTASFNGAGDTWTPTVLNLVNFWMWEIPLAYVLAVPLGMGPRGVFSALAIAFSTFAVSAAILFRRGRWKRTKV